MCDVEKYNRIFEDMKNLSQEDTMQLVLEAPSEEEKQFYEMISDYFLQMKQRDCIARNVF